MRKEDRTEIRNFLYALLACMCLSVVYWGILSPLYSVNDDVGMLYIACGIWGTYDSHLIFINILIGDMIKALMQAIPSVPWYSVVQCGVIFFAYTTIIFVLLEELGLKGTIFPFTVVTLFFGYKFFDGVQFSQTAGIASIAGILLMFSAIKRQNVWMHIIAGILIFLGSLYRFEIFQMLLIPLAGVGFYLITDHIREKNLTKILSYVLPFVVVFSCCFTAKIWDRQAYQNSEDWAAYVEWNIFRSVLMDYGFPDYEKNEALYQELDISQEDLKMVKKWNFGDPDIFNAASLQKLVAARENRQFSVNSFLDFVKTMMSGWTKYTFFPALLLSLILIFYDGREGDNTAKRRYLLLIYEFFAFGGVNLYLYYSGRYLKERVDISLLLAVVLILIVYCQKNKYLRDWKIPLLLSVTIVFCLETNIRNIYSDNKSQLNSNMKISQEKYRLSELLLGDTGHLYLYEVNGMKTTYELGYLPAEGSERNQYSLGGWGQRLPQLQKMLEEYEIKNPYRDAVDSQSVYFITIPSRNIDQSISYIQRHYAEDAWAELVKTTEDGYQIYRVLTKEPLLQTEYAVVGEGIIKSDLQWMVNEGIISGYIYGEGINSFSSNIYVEGLTQEGERQIYCAAQRKADLSDDVMSGAYGAFTCQAENLEQITAVYLESDDTLYRLAGTEVVKVETELPEKGL